LRESRQSRVRRRAEQIRASGAKKTPDRSGQKETEEVAELKELRRHGRQRVKTDTDNSDTGRQIFGLCGVNM
jgi:hypothetical protein